MKTKRELQGKLFPGNLNTLVAFLIVLIFSSFSSFSQTHIVNSKTDKALYFPGNTVNFTANTNQSQSGVCLRVRYFNRMTLLNTVTVTFLGTKATWSWTAPSNNSQGYLVSIWLMNGSTRLDSASIGVNVSSDYKKFPIYGFLSAYPSMTDAQMDAQMDVLNRYHINVIQFYDWMDTQQKPLCGTAQSPCSSWNDIANRATYFSTIKGYIDRGHNNYNMRSMFYDLIYGSYASTTFDASWYLYTTSSHATIWSNSMPSGWETTAINMMDPSNTNWQSYYLSNVNDVYNATNLHFDGWQIDQLGDWGYMYNSSGTQVDLAQTFTGFLQAAKNARSDKSIVMNAVNTYGQSLIVYQPVDFLYTEMWSGNQGYYNLGNVIQNNEAMSSSLKNVLAAYVNRGRSGSTGMFSDGSVLLCDATIFAFGGAHIELGEHMLCNEYFPNSNLSMSSSLLTSIKTYYDFAVAYENILRDGRTFNDVSLSGTNAQYWPPVIGKIATVGVSWGGNQVFHCLNYSNLSSLNWVDDQPTPTIVTNLAMSFPYSSTITRMWIASPDFNNGVPQQISYTQNNGVVSFTLPKLQYWTMVVAETSGGLKSALSDNQETEIAKPSTIKEALLILSAPLETKIRFTLADNQPVKIRLYDIQGHDFGLLVNNNFQAGEHEISINKGEYKPGVYICQMRTNNGLNSKKLVLN